MNIQRTAEKSESQSSESAETVKVSFGSDGVSMEAEDLTMLEVGLAIVVLLVAAFLIHRRWPAKHK